MIDPISRGALGPEFQVGGVGGLSDTPATGQTSFSGMLQSSLGSLNNLQNQAADQSQALATGQATDVASVVTTVEQAALAMQLAVSVRNKAVDAYQELMRMQI
jgi:flagellar hook-basal body complex protein FliE